MKPVMPLIAVGLCFFLVSNGAFANKKKHSKKAKRHKSQTSATSKPAESTATSTLLQQQEQTKPAEPDNKGKLPAVLPSQSSLTTPSPADLKTATQPTMSSADKEPIVKEVTASASAKTQPKDAAGTGDEDFSKLVVSNSGPQDPILNPKLLEVRNLFYYDQIEESLQLLLNLRDELKNDPNYWLGTATFFEIHSTMNSHLTATELKQREKIFFEATDQLGKLADKILDSKPKDYLGRFYKGISSGLRGKFYGERNQIITAYIESYPFYRQLIGLKEENPHDSKLLAPLGMFHYTVGVMGGIVSTVSSLLGGPTGDIPLSFKELSAAVWVPGFYQINNIYIYLPILLQNRHYSSVDQILSRTFKLYPHNSYLRAFDIESASLNYDATNRAAYLKELEGRLLQSAAVLELALKKYITYYEEYYVLAECRGWMRLGDSKTAEEQFAIYQKKLKRNSPLFVWFEPYLKAMKAAFKNDTSSALDLLQKSIDQGFPKVDLQALKFAPEWRSFQKNDRYTKMIQQQ